MDWIQVLAIIGTTVVAIISGVGGIAALTFSLDARHREDMKQAREEMKVIDEHHREDMRESGQRMEKNEAHWRDMFMHFNNRLDNNRRD